MMYFFDTEFIEDGRTIDLLSIGIVCEDGRELYHENAGADLSRADPWVKTNVIPRLALHRKNETTHKGGPTRLYKDMIAERILTFIGSDKPEFWGYYADYDWVVLCQLFGRMVDLPKGWPMFCMDLKQWCVDIGNPRLPDQGKDEHHALSDARWNRKVYDFLLAEEARLD